MKVPPLLPRFVVMPDGERFVPLEQVIAAHLDAPVPGHGDRRRTTPFRVTRNADLTLEEEEADDLLEAVEIELRRRRFGRAVRLEVDAEHVRRGARAARRASSTSTTTTSTRCDGPLDLGGLWALHGLDRPELKDAPWLPRHPGPAAADADDAVDFFRCSATATCSCTTRTTRSRPRSRSSSARPSRDPEVLAIKLTLYRTVGRQLDRHVARSAPPSGASRSPRWSSSRPASTRRPTSSGPARWRRRASTSCTGSSGLKTHTKTTLVVREEADGIRRYCHIGTGNYNPKTARLYEDLGLLTADPEIGADLTAALQPPHRLRPRACSTDKLLVVARRRCGRRIAELIEHEAAPRRRRPHHPEDEQPRRPRADRRAVRRVAGRAPRST